LKTEIYRLYTALVTENIEPENCALVFKLREDFVAVVGRLQRDIGTTLPMEGDEIDFGGLKLRFSGRSA
jgi:hypothetical protein